MKKTIYITEKQNETLKKKLTPQEQVGGKVNAGVMDAVCGGMCENVEDDVYELAPEKNQISPYYHVVDEDTNKENKMIDINQVIMSQSFKNWFGDWQNNPEDASKVVDKNGFPMIVHHGSPKFIGDKFDKSKIGHSMNYGEKGVFCTTQDMSWAKRFSYPASKGSLSFTVKLDYSKPGDILSGFLNLRHPLDFLHLTEQDVKNMWEMSKESHQAQGFKDWGNEEDYKKWIKDLKELNQIKNHQLMKFDLCKGFENFADRLKKYGYDGYIAMMDIKNSEAIEYCFLEPNQFKSIYSIAFDSNSDSIYEGKKKTIKNDEGEIVPEKCDKCGGDVVVQIHGEPIYICKKCRKYFGTVPCHINENIESETKWNGDGDVFNLKKPNNVPNKLYHSSPRTNRINIMKNGIFAMVGDDYGEWWDYEGPNGEYPDSEEMPGLVFLSDKPDTWTNLCWLDAMDVYQIDTNKLNKNNIYLDPTKSLSKSGCFCYAGDIPPQAIKFVDCFYKGKPVRYENKNNKKVLKESWEDLQDIYEDYGVYQLLEQFNYDKQHGIKTKKWKLIPAQQYHTLLQRYMESPQMARIPYNIVSDWFLNIIVPNAIDIENITNLAGHSSYFPSVDLESYFENFENNAPDFEDGSKYLEEIGFYDWCKFPDGTDAWTDYGLKPLFKIINSYTSNMSAEEILILINRCLDVTHWRGDLSSAFIEGGKNSLSRISGTMREYIEKENLLTENEGTNLRKARRYLESNGYTNPEQRQNILNTIRTDIPNARLADCKFMLGVTRMYLDGELSNGQAIMNLNKALKYIASDAHVNEYDYNLNGENLNTLVIRFSGVSQTELKSDMEASNKRKYIVNNDYTIVPINSFYESSKYGKYTSWCVTQNKNMFDSYTNEGTGRFYFCLRNGFQNERKLVGEGCPLDSYGLSMIAVSVDMDGACNTITCRWNHDYGGNDNIMNVQQLEELLGRNFYQTFKPYTRDELHAKGIILFDEVQDLLDSGKKPKEIFQNVEMLDGGFKRVQLNGKYNIIDKQGKLLNNIWFNSINISKNGFAIVELNNKWNFIDEQGKILSSKWFDFVDYFKNGFAMVELNNKWNFIDKQGNLLSNQWFDCVGDFNEGFAKVELNNKWNYIDKQGKLLSNQWFYLTMPFKNGFGKVELNNKWNFIDKQGNLLSNQWFDSDIDFINGFGKVELNNKWNFIDEQGKILSSKWFDFVYSFSEGFAVVELNNKWNCINKQGNLLFNQWFDYVYNFSEGFAMVELNNKKNYIDKQGNLLSKQWFDYAWEFDNGIAQVYYDGKQYYIDKNGNLTLKENKKNGNNNIINESGILNENEGTNLKKARRYLELQGYTNPEQRQEILNTIRNNIPNVRLADCKFILGVTRMYIDGELNYDIIVQELNKTLKYVASNAHVNEYNNNLNNESVNVLIDRFRGISQSDLKTDMEASNKRKYNINNDYTIVPIDNFEESSKYGKYTSWCVTQDYTMYNSYTSNGSGRFYFCLKNGFKNVKKIEGENCPLDEYGLSMIAVSVDMDGACNTITCRWNHDNSGNDNVMSIEELEKIIGRNFYQTFKPYTRDELHQKGVILFDEVEDLLNSGMHPIEIFDSCELISNNRELLLYKVGLNDKYNLLKKNFNENNNVEYKLISNNWFDFVYGNINNNFRVILKGKYNIMDLSGNFLFDKWFDYVGTPSWGVYLMKLNNKYNYINKYGKILSNVWFDYCYDFANGFGVVYKDGLYNYVNLNGEIAFDKWFERAGNFITLDYAQVKYNGKWYILDSNGTMKIYENVKNNQNFINEIINNEDLNPDEVDLTSFNINNNLNKIFWKNNKLDSKIRLKLLDIAQDFIDYLNVSWVVPEDIIITGSLANYNWNKKYSDIDLHILYDFSDVDENVELVKNYFQSKKSQWNNEHKDLKLFGFPVELYVQDINEEHSSSGVYSLNKNEWIETPDKDELLDSKINKQFIKERVSFYANEIDKLVYLYNKNKHSKYKLEKIQNKAEKLFDIIKAKRKEGFDKYDGKEVNNYNLIFKSLRRYGYLDKLSKLKTKTYDKINSF